MNRFYNHLLQRQGDAVFNPWLDRDTANDADISAPEKRLRNLKNYLKDRKDAPYLLVAEALGYQGGHFSGIPMTSERIILGNKIAFGIHPHLVSTSRLERTSNTLIHADGFNEPTATIVWRKIIELGLSTFDFVFWNAFPWHPYKNAKGILSNRTPTDGELELGREVLELLIKNMNFRKIISLGNKSFETLTDMGIECNKIRHPANGGATAFRIGIERLTGNCP
jgi:hypothetical protein